MYMVKIQKRDANDELKTPFARINSCLLSVGTYLSVLVLSLPTRN